MPLGSVARRPFTFAIELDPKSGEYYSWRGKAWQKMGEYDKAIKDCTRAIEVEPKDFSGYNRRGLVWVEQEKYDKAIDDYSRAIELAPEIVSHICLVNRCIAWMKKEEYEKAVEDCNQAIANAPREFMKGKAFEKRAEAYFNLKKYEQAWKDVKKAQELGREISLEFLDRLRKASPENGK